MALNITTHRQVTSNTEKTTFLVNHLSRNHTRGLSFTGLDYLWVDGGRGGGVRERKKTFFLGILGAAFFSAPFLRCGWDMLEKREESAYPLLLLFLLLLLLFLLLLLLFLLFLFLLLLLLLGMRRPIQEKSRSKGKKEKEGEGGRGRGILVIFSLSPPAKSTIFPPFIFHIMEKGERLSSHAVMLLFSFFFFIIFFFSALLSTGLSSDYAYVARWQKAHTQQLSTTASRRTLPRKKWLTHTARRSLTFAQKSETFSPPSFLSLNRLNRVSRHVLRAVVPTFKFPFLDLI